MTNKIKLEFKMSCSYRQIAIVLAYGMQIQGQEYSDVIESYIKSIEAMPPAHQQALKASYIFSRLAPIGERDDLFQELVSHILTFLAKRETYGVAPIKNLEAFCYSVAHNKWRDMWKQKKNRAKILNGGFVSLNHIVRDCDSQEIELHETIADNLDLESELNSKLDSQAVLDTLPDRVKAIVIKNLLDSERLSKSESCILYRHKKQNGHEIREALRA